MAVIKVSAVSFADGSQKEFSYDNLTGVISDYVASMPPAEVPRLASVFSKENPVIGKVSPQRLKIQMGLACNYACSYCSQKNHAQATVKQLRDITPLTASILKNANPESLEKVELWGGEPLLYLPVLKKLVLFFREHYPKTSIGVISNGSLLTREIINFFCENSVSLSVSHDGPGQHLRGEDSIEKNIDVFRYALRTLGEVGKFCFNPTLSSENYSRAECVAWFEERFGKDAPLMFGEFDYIRPYSEDGLGNTPLSDEQIRLARRVNWLELKADLRLHAKIPLIQQIVGAYIDERDISRHGQKCGIDRKDHVIIDMQGNVLSCQNTSATSISENGVPHKIGHYSAPQDVKLNTGTWWQDRPHCQTCVVVRSCKGACFFSQGDNFKWQCDMAFTGHISLFALAFEMKTGYVPVYIDDPDLPRVRRDIWLSEVVPKGTGPFPEKTA